MKARFLSRHTVMTAVVGAAVGAALGGLGTSYWLQPIHGTPPVDSEPADAAPPPLTLPPTARITLTEARKAVFQPPIMVPARLSYDTTRYVSLFAAAEGVITEVIAGPGQHVRKGEKLGTYHCPEIGAARADLALRRDEWELAKRQLEWDQSAYEHIQSLLKAIDARTDYPTLEAEFRDRVLGEARDKIFSAYSRLLLAESLLASSQSLQQSGSISAATVRQRASDRETAAASLLAACEQVRFDARMRRDRSQVALDDAHRRVASSRQRLTSLLGYEDSEPTSVPEPPSALAEIRATADGTIERRNVAVGERVHAGDELWALADTSRLWVRGDIREQDWLAMDLPVGAPLQVLLPGAAGRSWQARVVYVGRESSPETNSIPLVAEIDNADGQLRPGMFARVAVPAGKPREAILLPERCVMTHEHHTFVFIPGGNGQYVRQDVVCGDRQGDDIEIVQGVQPGDRVVEEGAFLLKSALLLQGEEE